MGRTGDGDAVTRLYRRLLDLEHAPEAEPLLDEALALIVEATGAALGYLELQGPGEALLRKGHRAGEPPSASLHTAVSHGIIRHVLGAGETLETSSALDDARFQDLGSVRQHAINAVLAAPIGRRDPIGVIYLQRATRFAGGGGGGGYEPRGFTLDAREQVELFARALEPIAGRLLGEPASATTLAHATARFQRRYLAEILDRTHWNVSEAARVLGVSRSSLYELMKVLGIRRKAP